MPASLTAEASGHRLVIQVLRVFGLGEEQPAIGLSSAHVPSETMVNTLC
jgi:hypothetical protein